MLCLSVYSPFFYSSCVACIIFAFVLFLPFFIIMPNVTYDIADFLRRCRDLIRVPRIKENYHRVPKIREYRVPRIREIGSLQIHTST